MSVVPMVVQASWTVAARHRTYQSKPARCVSFPARESQLTASNGIIDVVRNPDPVVSLGPSVAAGGKEECGRKEDGSIMHLDCGLSWMDLEGLEKGSLFYCTSV